MGEPLLQFRTGAGWHLNCVDLHHGHYARLPCLNRGLLRICWAPRRHDRLDLGGPAALTTAFLTARGGCGRPLVLVHGLMGRGSTWSRQLPWLVRLAEVYTHDAPWHRGRDVADPYPISTERFVSDLAAAVEGLERPVILVGHSMGALHSWCLAAARPDLVAGVVVEDMAPDFVGGTTGPWEPWLHALPVEFGSVQQIYDEFGPV